MIPLHKILDGPEFQKIGDFMKEHITPNLYKLAKLFKKRAKTVQPPIEIIGTPEEEKTDEPDDKN